MFNEVNRIILQSVVIEFAKLIVLRGIYFFYREKLAKASCLLSVVVAIERWVRAGRWCPRQDGNEVNSHGEFTAKLTATSISMEEINREPEIGVNCAGAGGVPCCSCC